ncbi:MAG: hypothetical protein ACOH2J_13690 [Allorhizobium sp.]
MTANGPSLENIWTATVAKRLHPMRAAGLLFLVLCTAFWLGLATAGSDAVRANSRGSMSAAEKFSRTPSLAARDAMRSILSAERQREPAAGGRLAAGLLPVGHGPTMPALGEGTVLPQGSQAAVRDHQSTGYQPRAPPSPFA